MNLGEKILHMRTKANMSQGDLDELVRGDKEKSVDESRVMVNNGHLYRVETQKYVGFGLIGFGAVVFSLSLFLGDLITALVLFTPFLVTGLINLFIKKRPAL